MNIKKIQIGLLVLLSMINLDVLSEQVIAEKTPVVEKFQHSIGRLKFSMGGKVTNETFVANNMTLLNSSVLQDLTFYIRTTADYSFSTCYMHDKVHIDFYNSLRFRFKWGTSTETKNADSFINVASNRFTVKGTATNKHLLWMREGWVKAKLGLNESLDHYVQVGLVPYQVGRGISLGDAYQAEGFLGFTPGFSIDQYAPGIVFNLNPIKDRLSIDAYWAMTENNQVTIRDNFEPIRDGIINGCSQRGVGRQSFLNALRAQVLFKNDAHKITIEPYLVHQHAPDQDLEFKNDVDSFVSTAGLALEAEYKRFNWGGEAAVNFGEYDISAWDRNQTKLVKNSDSFVVQQYTKVFTQDPATCKNPAPAPATSSVAQVICGSEKVTENNGKQIGTAIINNVPTPIYNAFDRIRPEQRRLLKGYFFVLDGSYICIPKVLTVSAGIGYASGYNDAQRDVNKLNTNQLMNEKFTGFVPLQSVYSGTRLDHLVIFNQGIPRFNVRFPNADLSKKNVTSVVQPDTINEMTNIAFVGTRLEWHVQQLKKHKICIMPNVIAYWAPEPSSFKDRECKSHVANHFLGTEITTKFSALFIEKLKLASYVGVLIPGQHYKDMAGTVVAAVDNRTTGCDLGFIANIGLSYLF